MRRARKFLILALAFAILPAAAAAQNWNQAPSASPPGDNLPGPIWNANAPGFFGPQSAAISITGNGGFGANLSVGGASGFGGYSPAAGLSISAPQAYFGDGVKGTIIGAYAGFTTAGDILTDGLVKAVSFQGDGSLLISLNADNLALGTVPVARLSGTYNIDISGHAAYLGASTAVTADATGNLSAAVVTAPSICLSGDCKSAWPAGGGGGGTVTYVGAGGGLVAEPVPDAVTGNGSLNVVGGTGISVTPNAVSLDTVFTDNRYVNVSGDSLTGDLNGPRFTASTQLNSNGTLVVFGNSTLWASAGFGGNAPDATWRVSSPNAYFGNGLQGTIIGAGSGQGAGDLKSDGTIQGGTVKATGNLCIGADCRAAWPAGGGGSVTSISAGTGIIATPNPIIGAGSIALDTVYADNRYLNAAGDTVTGNLMGAQSITAGNYWPDATWRVSSPNAYFGDGFTGTIIGFGNGQNAGDLTSDGTITGSFVKGLNQLCIGADCRNTWPQEYTNSDTLQIVTTRGATTNILTAFQSGISATGNPAGAFTGNVTVSSGNLTSSGGIVAAGGGFSGICATSGAGCTGGNAAIGGAVKAEQFCLPGANPSGGCINTWPVSGGTISGVTAGSGLIGGGVSGAVTLDVQTGNGIVVNGDTVQLDPNYLVGPYVRKAGDTMTGSLVLSGGTTNLSVGGNGTVSGGLNVGSASGAATGEIKQSGRWLTVNSGGAFVNPGYYFGPSASGYPSIYYDNGGGATTYLRTTTGLTVPQLTISPGAPVAAPSGIGLYTQERAYFLITAPYGTGGRVEIGNGSGPGGAYGLYVRSGASVAKFENTNGLVGVSLADQTIAVDASNNSPTYVGKFTNSASSPNTIVSLADTNYGIAVQGAGVYGGTFTNRNSTALAYIAGTSYGIYASAPAGGYAIYANGQQLIQGGGSTNIDLAVNGRIRTGDAANFGGVYVGPAGTGLFMGQKSATEIGFWNNAWRFWVTAAGDTYASGHIYAHTSTHIGDVAEPIKVEAGVEKGDVVVIDAHGSDYEKTNFRKAKKAYDSLVAGVVSTNPSLYLANDKDRSPLAVSGVVPVKIDASYGAVKPGDLLTSSATPGYAMKASDLEKARGAVIGKALEPLESGQGKILMLITLQ